MSGGKSESKTQTTTTSEQTTVTPNVTGITGSTVLQGQTVTLNDQFPDTVAHAFSDLINFAGAVAQGSKEIAQGGIAAAAGRDISTVSPTTSSVNSVAPLAIIGIAGALIVYIWRKK